MTDINLAEDQARRLVDRLFEANSTPRGQICEWPVIGGHYVSGSDPTKGKRAKAVRALLARDWFADNGPPDAQPLPLSYDEREDMKGGRGLLYYIVALYARSLEGRNYDLNEHPAPSDYIGGVLWEAEYGDLGTGAQAAIKKHLDYQSAKGMSDQDRLFRQTPNLLLEVIDQSLDGDLCKARIGTSTQLFCWPVQIWPLRNDNTAPFGLKEIAKAGPAIGGDPRAMDQHDGLRHRFRSDRMIDVSCRLPLAFLVANGLTEIRDRCPVRMAIFHLS